MEPQERHGIRMTPGSLADSLNALEGDNEFLVRGGVLESEVLWSPDFVILDLEAIDILNGIGLMERH